MLIGGTTKICHTKANILPRMKLRAQIIDYASTSMMSQITDRYKKLSLPRACSDSCGVDRKGRLRERRNERDFLLV